MANRLSASVFAVDLLLGASGCLRAATPDAATSHVPIVGLPCEGCEAVFADLPEAPTATARIAPPGEPGEPLRIDGTVAAADGKPAPGVVVYAYHTDASGHYPPDPPRAGHVGSRHGRLRGWAKTDAAGHYRFETIRPAGYPGTDIPSHVHLHVIEPGRCSYYIDDILFDDDPRLTVEKRRRVGGRGGNGIAVPQKDHSGGWTLTRDIRLGERIPGYDACDGPAVKP